MLKERFIDPELPREKIIKYGPATLSNAELLSLIIRTGGNNEDVLDLSNRLLLEFGGLNSLYNVSFERLKNIKNVGVVKACSIKACLELALRLKSLESSFKVTIKNPGDVFKLVSKDFFERKKETLYLISLDSKSCFISKKVISIGTINATIISPREVYKEAINQNAVRIILVHNHPSGDLHPSIEDIESTTKIILAGDLIGIPLIDHIIVAGNNYISLKSIGIFEGKINREEVKNNA